MSSTSYPRNAEDWRGRFIVDLAAGLGRRSDVRLTIWAPPGTLPPNVGSAASADDERWLHTLSERGGIAHLLRHHKLRAAVTTLGLLHRLRNTYRRQPAHLVHVNWLQNALPLWGSKTPAIVSVLGSDFGLLRMPGMRTALRQVFGQRRTVIAPNAHWMAPQLESMFGDIARIVTVPFGIDASWFALQRRPAPHGVHQWLCVTRVTRAKIGDLFDWGNGLFGPHRMLHLFGPMQETLTLPDWVQYHGATHPAALLGEWFPKASGLITLSRHDEGRPQVMLEAMAAGLPVIASDLAAHRDIIRHQHTGWLCGSREQLQGAFTALEDPLQNDAIGQAARQWARDDIGTWDDCAGRYALLYAALLEENHDS